MVNALIAAITIACAAPASAELSTGTVTFPSGKTIVVELAIDPADQERGLMFRTALPEDYGMLFLFERDEPTPFWMKNTWVDLDIVYISEKRVINKIFHRVPKSNAKTTDEQVAKVYGSGKYVLELPAGAAKRYKLKKGDKLKFNLGKKR